MNRPLTAEAHAAPPLTPPQIRLIMIGVVLAMLLGALDQTIVATALPTIGRELDDVQSLSWVVTAYLLSSTAVTPLYGKLSDIHGRRLMLLIAIAIFLVGSVACAVSAQHLRPDRRPRLPGPRRRRPDLARPDDRRRRRAAARARPLPGVFRRDLRHLVDRRAGARRLLRRVPALVLHLLDQPAARRRRLSHDQPRAEAPAAP